MPTQNDNTIKKIMDKLNTINYGYLDEQGINIFDNDSSIEYDFVNLYHLMSPSELIQKKYGTCWDQVELERELFDKTGIPFKTYFVYIDDDNYLPSHTFLVYQEDNNYCWFEHSWYSEQGIHKYNNLNSLFYDITKKHISSHQNEISGKFPTYIYEYSKPDYNISCEDFYNFIFTQTKVYTYNM